MHMNEHFDTYEETQLSTVAVVRFVFGLIPFFKSMILRKIKINTLECIMLVI